MPHALHTSVEDFVEGLKAIEQGLITTVHAYTSDQQLQDMATVARSGKPDLRSQPVCDLRDASNLFCYSN